ncbi:MAG: hypothetical protein ACFFCP_13070 [Promethearchaeota archaeon]
MTTDAIDPARKDLTGNSPKILLLIEDDEQKESLRHPIRKRILRVLSVGVLDYETEVTTEVQTLDDGTGLTRSVEVRRPVKRYWMVVPEIVEQFEKRYPEHEITNYQCYYHLQKLEEQGLVEQDPPPEFDERGRKKRVRGLQFQSAARFFIQNSPRLSKDCPTSCIELLQNVWRLEPSEEDSKKLIQLIAEQDQALLSAFEYLVSHMDDPVDSMSFSLLLDRLAHVYLSDNERFIERYRDAKRILVRSGGEYLDADVTMPTPVAKDDAKEQETRGNIDD